MFSRRDFVSALALIVLSGISLAAAAQAYFFGWAADRAIDRGELLGRLSSPQFASLPRSAKLRLARRFEQEMAAGGDWRNALGELDPAKRAQFQQNLAELSQVWLIDKVDRYYELREPERTAFIDNQIDSLARWPLVDAGDDFNAGGDPSRILAQLQGRYGQLKPDEQRRIQQFIGAVYMRWLARGFRQLLPLGPDENGD